MSNPVEIEPKIRELVERYDSKKEQLGEKGLSELSEANLRKVGSSRVDLQACKLEYSIVSPK